MASYSAIVAAAPFQFGNNSRPSVTTTMLALDRLQFHYHHYSNYNSMKIKIFRDPAAMPLGGLCYTGRRYMSSIKCFSALNQELKATLDKVVTSHKVVLFMKGTKEFPQCGFSNTVVQILKSLNVPFETIDILENEILRQGLKEYSSWPTFPQLYIDGEFFGGCDITVEAYKSGELQELLEKAICSDYHKPSAHYWAASRSFLFFCVNIFFLHYKLCTISQNSPPFILHFAYIATAIYQSFPFPPTPFMHTETMTSWISSTAFSALAIALILSNLLNKFIHKLYLHFHYLWHSCQLDLYLFTPNSPSSVMRERCLIPKGIRETIESIAVVISVFASCDLNFSIKGEIVRGHVMAAGFENYVIGAVEKQNLLIGLQSENIVSWNALISSYAQSGLCDEVGEFRGGFDGKTYCCNWTAVISGFSAKGRHKKCLGFFDICSLH